MKFKAKIVWAACVLALCSQCLNADNAPVRVSSIVSLENGKTNFVFSVENISDRKLLVSKIGVNDSPVVLTKPNGEIENLAAIVDFVERPLPNFLPSSRYESRKEPLEEMSKSRLYESGIYRFSLKTYIDDKYIMSDGFLVYREETAPRFLPFSEESIDSPQSVAESLKSGSYEQNQEIFRSRQIAATEGTKQFFFANPFVVALSVDGKPGLKVALFATNVERKPVQFPKENSQTNYLEVKTPTGQVLRVDMGRMMKPAEKHDGALAVGETRKWIGNVSDVLRDKEVEAPGRYVVTWVVEDAEVGSFTFVRPEPKPQTQPAPK